MFKIYRSLVAFIALGLVAWGMVPLRAQDPAQLSQHLTAADAYYKQRDYARSVQSYQQALPLAQQFFGAQHANVGAIMGQIGVVYREMSEPAKAKPYLEGALRIYELGTDSVLKSEGMNNLAAVYVELGQFAEAKGLHEKSLQLMKSLHGPESPQYAISLGNLAGVYRALGQDGEAEPLLRKSVLLLSKAGERHLGSLANGEMNLANLYNSQREFVRSEQLYLHAIGIVERLGGVNHIEAARIRNNLATLYQSVGLYEKAIAEHSRSLKIFQAALGNDGLDAARSMANLAAIYTLQKKYTEADELYRKVIVIREAKLGREHPDLALTLMSLGLTLQKARRFDESRQLIERSLEIRRKAVGEFSPPVSDSLYALGMLSLLEQKTDDAEARMQEALKVKTRALPTGHPDFAIVHNSLAMIRARQKQWHAAAAEYDLGRRRSRSYVNQVLPGLSDHEQLTFLRETDEPYLHAALQLAVLNPRDEKIIAQSAEWVLNGKAIAQQAVAQRALSTRDNANPALAGLVAELQKVRKQLASATHALTAANGPQNAPDIAALTAQEAEASRKLTLASGRPTSASWIALDDVRNCLQPDSLFVNILRVQAYDFTALELQREEPGRYCAWISRNTSDEVTFVDLGDAAVIDAAVRHARTALAQATQAIGDSGEAQAEGSLRQALAPLTDKLLKPILKNGPMPKHLVLSPDSLLWLVPWCALPFEEEAFAIEKFTVQYVVSGRELVEKTTFSKTGQPILFADPAYDLDPNAIRAATREIFRQQLGNEAPLTATASRLGIAAPLPGTKLEATAVQPKIKELTTQDAVLYTDRFALEAVFKAIHNPRVLMLSTHGFFQDPVALSNGTASTVNPLLGCGLLLAGCNRPPAQIATDAEDGILTGLEIVQTDLRGTELVVLSACETGLGEVRNGEGVAGLRQAFQLAGAKTVISTLWQIPDRDSALIVTDFFQQLSAGQNRAEALRSAQLKRIEARRNRNGAAHPFFWAAWTVTGE